MPPFGTNKKNMLYANEFFFPSKLKHHISNEMKLEWFNRFKKICDIPHMACGRWFQYNSCMVHSSKTLILLFIYHFMIHRAHAHHHTLYESTSLHHHLFQKMISTQIEKKNDIHSDCFLCARTINNDFYTYEYVQALKKK